MWTLLAFSKNESSGQEADVFTALRSAVATNSFASSVGIDRHAISREVTEPLVDSEDQRSSGGRSPCYV